MIIGVIGNGIVGKATSILKNNNVELLIYYANPTTLAVGLLRCQSKSIFSPWLRAII